MGPSNDKRSSSRAGHGEWLVNVSDDVVAPMTTLEVIDALRKGRLSEEALVWRVGMRNWTAVLDVPQLRLAASARPPPPSVAAPANIAAVTAAVAAEPTHAAEHEYSAEYLDSSEHFESVNDAELEEGDEPVTTLMRESSASMMQSSLAPTTAEAAASARQPGDWGNIDELLSGERRAEQQHTRRVVLWAALGSAAMAAAFTLLVVRSPTRHESAPAQGEQPSSAPELLPVPTPASATPIDAAASASASASAIKPAPAAPRAGPQRGARHPKHAASSLSATADAPGTTTPAPNETTSAPIAVVPGAAPEPAASTSAAAPSPPAPTSESP